MRYFCIFFCLLLVGFAHAQVNIDRVEVPLNNANDEYHIITLEEKGLLLFVQDEGSLFGNGQNWTITHYDTSMVELWAAPLTIKNGKLDFQGFDVEDDKVYLYFQKYSRGEYSIVEVDPLRREVHEFELFSFKNMEYVDFKVIKGWAFILGNAKRTPMILHCQLNKQKRPVVNLLQNSFTKKSEVPSLAKDTVNQIINMTINNWKGGKNHMVAKAYYPKGETAFEIPLRHSTDKNLLNGHITLTKYGKMLVIGTYSNRNSEYSDGLFIAEHNGQELAYVKFHNFASLNNFLNYMSEGKQGRIEKKLKKKKEKGKDLNLQYRLNVHELIQKKEQNIMIAEAYYPVYRTERVYDWYYGSRVYTYVRVFDGYEFTHAMAAGFDQKGNLTWDNSFELDRVRYRYLRPVVRAGVRNDYIKLSYSFKGELRSKFIKGNDLVEEVSESEMATGHKADKIKRSFEDRLDYWFGNYFVAWGIQRIKNKEEGELKGKRNVFYFNKISF
ncbi:hypothetical protein AAG747_15700 [Rapidithrix thailandica]|uniref:Uncharacterized protein n=1 Tax=Rapidithrix thailandica TaxID=413964 RepID=A0AAW9S671_9BACT